MQYLKQSTAINIMMGPFLDDSDGKTQEAALTIAQSDVRLSKNGANFAQKSAAGNLTHNEKAWYVYAMSTTDTNTLGRLIVAIHVAGALPVWREMMVIPAQEYDSLILGSDNLQVDMIEATAEVTTDAASRTASKADVTNLDVAVSSRSSHTATNVWSVGTRTLSSFGTLAQDIWDKLTSALTTAGSIGKLLVDNVNTTISSRAPSSEYDTEMARITANVATEAKQDTIDTVVDAIKTKTDNLPNDPASNTEVNANETKIDTVDTVVDGIKAKTDLIGASVQIDKSTEIDGIKSKTDLIGASVQTDKSTEIDAIKSDLEGVNTELASVPTTTSSILKMIQYIFQWLRNKKETTGSKEIMYKEDATTKLGEANLSDDGTTFTKNEMV